MISHRTVIQAVLVSSPKVRQWPSVSLTFFDSAREGKWLAAGGKGSDIILSM